jgi:hypothetical protein
MSPENMRPAPEEMGINPEQKDNKKYEEQTNVNGIDIDVHWDNGYRDFVIYFPQIDLSHAWEKEKNVSDQVLRLTRKPEVAKQVFDFAVKKAGEVKNVYDLFREVNKFSRDLPDDDED